MHVYKHVILLRSLVLVLLRFDERVFQISKDLLEEILVHIGTFSSCNSQRCYPNKAQYCRFYRKQNTVIISQTAHVVLQRTAAPTTLSLFYLQWPLARKFHMNAKGSGTFSSISLPIGLETLDEKYHENSYFAESITNLLQALSLHQGSKGYISR